MYNKTHGKRKLDKKMWNNIPPNNNVNKLPNEWVTSYPFASPNNISTYVNIN
jgi:hypothetical protein